MLAEVKKCADKNDIKGLRYIFIDSLDVDPTFEKYEQDYTFCKKLRGFFDEHIEITCMKENPDEWDAVYWDQLKRDLNRNFSQKRFEHMIQVAKVVYSGKIARLVSERRAKKIEAEKQIERVIPTGENINSAPVAKEKITIHKNIEPKISESSQREIDESLRAYEESERKKEMARRYAEQKKQKSAEQEKPKKWMGIVVAAVIILIVLIVVLLKNNPQ